MENKRPTKQFELLRMIEQEIGKDENLMKLPYKERYQKIMDIYYYLNKELKTKLAIHDLRINFNNVFGEILNNDDIGSPLNDNSYDVLITPSGRNRIVKLKFGEEIIKVQFKMPQPTALDKSISLSPYLVKKYIENKCSVIIVIPTPIDPNYYNLSICRELLYFPLNKKKKRGITVKGYQYYLIPYKNLDKVELGWNGNYIYPVKHNTIMFNIGLRYKNGQLHLGDFKNDKSI